MNKSLKECCCIELSNVDKKSKPNQKRIRLCNFTDVYYNWNIYNSMSEEYMKATASEENISKFSLRKGDVVITKDSETRDDIGMSAYVAEDVNDLVLGYHCALIRPKDKLDGAWLNGFLSSKFGRKYFSFQSSGSGQRYTLTKDAIGSIRIPHVDYETQKEIGRFLTRVDQKIRNNKKISVLLEEQTKTIYDYWFTQFDFPDENGKPYKSSGGKMVWNEELKRVIPEGWEVNHFDEVFKITMGCSPNGDSINEKREGMPFFQGKTDFGLRFPTVRTFTTSSLRQALYGDTLLSVRAPVGALNRAIEDCSIGRGIASIRLYKYPSFTYYTCLAMRKFFEIYDAGGTTFGCIGKDNLHSILCVVPPKEIIQNYEKLATSADQCIENCQKECDMLSSIRNFLLPMLMNGQATIDGLNAN